MKPEKECVHPIIQKTDLLSVSRSPDRCRTSVSIRLDWDWKQTWLLFGACQLSATNQGRTHYLEGRASEGVTDFEHDSVVLVRLPLIGVQFDNLLVHGHTTHLVAWVDSEPSRKENFHVPRPGYDPASRKDAWTCQDQGCQKPHRVVPEGFYVPPFDEELYEAVRGREVEIRIGPAIDND